MVSNRKIANIAPVASRLAAAAGYFGKDHMAAVRQQEQSQQSPQQSPRTAQAPQRRRY